MRPDTVEVKMSTYQHRMKTVTGVKDGERYIGTTQQSLKPLDCAVLLLDNGSANTSTGIVRDFGVVDYYPNGVLQMDKGQGTTALLMPFLSVLTGG